MAVSTTLGLGLFGLRYSGTLRVLHAERAAASDNLEFKELESLEESVRFFIKLVDLSADNTFLARQARDQSSLIQRRLEQMGSAPLALGLSEDRALMSESTETVAQMLTGFTESQSQEEIGRLENELDVELVLLRSRCDDFVEHMNLKRDKNVELAEKLRGDLETTTVLGALLYLCLVLLLWRWTSKTVIDPLQSLTGEAEKAEDGGLEIKPHSVGPYEVRVLSRAISGLVQSLGQHSEVLEETVKTRTQELVRANQDLLEEIVQRERAEEALSQHEEKKREDHKMEALGRLAGGVAHDFNNLLTAIVGYSDLSISRMDPEDPEIESLKQIRLAGERASVLTRQLLLLGRRQINQPVVLSLATVATNMQKILQSMLGEKVSLELVVEEEGLAVEADQGQIEQVLMNLCVNARDAIEGFGTVKISIGSVAAEGDGPRDVYLYVDDDGVGLDRETQARMFEPYFSTKPIEKGTGLGLSIVYGIMQQNQGRVEVRSTLGEGTSMRLFFPASTEEPVAEDSGPTERIASSGDKRILLAEDEEVLRSLVSSTLEFAGYQVVQASNGEEALSRFEEGGGEFDMIVTDVVMPSMGGRELVQAVKRSKPDMKVLYLSGHIADDELQEEITRKGSPFLPKPFKPSELTRRVMEILDGVE